MRRKIVSKRLLLTLHGIGVELIISDYDASGRASALVGVLKNYVK